MDGGHTAKTRNTTALAAPVGAPEKLTTRPGLPLNSKTLQTGQSPVSDINQATSNAQPARDNDDARKDQDQTNEETAEGAGSDVSAAQTGSDTAGADQSGPSGQDEETTQEDAGDTQAESNRIATPLRTAGGGRASPYSEAKMPKLPIVRLPDQAGLRSPVVPPPPKSAQKKRFDILKTTGMLPENHHAAVQRSVDTTTAKARSAKSHVIFQTGTIAARARARITNLSHEVAGVVGGGVTRIRAAAAAAQSHIDVVTEAQIQKVIDKEQTAAGDMTAVQVSAEVQMHNMLMTTAPQELRDAKADMDAELARLNTDAGAKIAAIKTGTEPSPLPAASPPPDGAVKEPTEPPDPRTVPPSPPTWDQAEAEIDGQLATGITGAQLTEYANLRCRSALPGLVNPVQEEYDAANNSTVDELTSDETKTRFFDQTMGLIAPTISAEADHTNRVKDDAYVGNLSQTMRLAYKDLDRDKQAIIRQLDEKRTILKTETLNPDFKDSQPFMAIDGLRKAGKKIEDGMIHQALVIEASLKANLASFSAEYPGIVARLMPIIDTGGFLEAASVLRQIDAANDSVQIMQDGQLEQLALQAENAYAQAQKGLAEQLTSLRKTARQSVDIVGETSARVEYSLIATTVSYTGDMDESVRSTFPQIIAHAERTAENLLRPNVAKDGELTNLKNAAISFMNGVIMGEWGRYVGALNGLEERLGGNQQTVLSPVVNSAQPFGQIRKDVVRDSKDRAKNVEDALSPPPLSNDQRVVLYGGALILAPLTLGASIGVAAYDYHSDPNETKVVEALSVPHPGPAGINEAQQGPFRGRRTSLIDLITDRMSSEGEQADILNLFSADADVTRQAKNNLFAGASDFGGISSSAALGLMQSLSAAEINSSVMTEAETQRMADALQNSLSDPTDREIAAAYMNGEPDQALAIRMRRLIDSQNGKEYNNQLRTGQELDKLVRQELFAGGRYAYVPPEEMLRMRNAAILRFDEVSREGRSPVTLNMTGDRPQALEGGAVSPTQLRTEGRQVDMSIGRAEGVGYDSRTGGVQNPTIMSEAPVSSPDTANMSIAPPPVPPAPNGPDALMPREDATTHDPQSVEEAADQAATLRTAQDAVIAYMNRPLHSYKPRENDQYAEQNVANFYRHDHRHPQTQFNPETGKIEVSPASAIQAYNTALIRHGSGHPETRGALAAATIARIPDNREPSENQINLLNENFTDSGYNQIRVEWTNASPQQRMAMRARWLDAQEDHKAFLRSTARQMGMDDAQLDDTAAVETYLSDQLGDRFGEVDDSFQQAGRQIITKGRMDIDTGMRLAAEGWGTNEALMQNIMANRSDFEWNEERSNGQTMQTFAYNVADSELSGDDWQQAREKLRGEDRDDFERAETAQFLIDQQLEDGTGFFASFTMGDSWQRQDLLDRREEVDTRLLEATQAGMAEARRRGADIPLVDDISPVRMPGGGLNPLIRRYAMDGNGALRGSGADMSALIGDVRQSADYYREEIDRQEGFLTSIIMAVAVIASVLAMLIPGVNAVVAGIWIALLSGAATVAVKAGMRGNRYGWEEATVDVGTSVVEAATAGVAGALSKGAQLGTAAKVAAAAQDTAEIASNAAKIAKLGKVGRAGLALEARLGPTGAAMVSEVTTNVASGTVNAAMNDEMWNDGMGTGLTRLAGHGLQSGATAALNVGLSGAVTRGLDKRLAPIVGKAETVGNLTRIGRKLGPQGRELVTEVTAGLAGNLSAEGVNILADMARHPDKMTVQKALERLGKSGLKELFTTAGKGIIKQRHRARANALSAKIMQSGKAPDAADMLLLTKLSQSGGLVPPGTTVSDMSRKFSHAQARITQMPADLQPHLQKMSPDKALSIIAMLDSGRLGTRAERIAMTNALGQDVVDLDVTAFDKLLIKANEAHAPERRARKARIKAARRHVLNELPVEARARIGAIDLDGLADLSPEAASRIAKALARGEPLDGILNDALGGQPGLRDRLATKLDDANTIVTQVKADTARAKARIDDDLAVAMPKAIAGQFSQLSETARANLHAALSNGDAQAAQHILQAIGLSDATAKRVATSMTRHVEAQNIRRSFMDNVAPEHHQTMGQLTPDMLMEVRVAQFTRKPLSTERLNAILAEVKIRRRGADLDSLRTAITATMNTRHGRPGFRAALAQKRAFLDLIPLGMKRKVLQTPIITLDDAAFLSFVRGSGSENAVTLIVNGQPVVLMRASADPVKLAEEGLHVLQFHDPEFHKRVSGLDESHVARWEELDFENRIKTYGEKVDIEIDGQRRMIARLEKRVQSSWMTSTKTQALRQLELAHEALDNLTARRSEMRALTPQAHEEMRLGLRPEPDWLHQPARMFSKESKSDQRLRQLLPHARQPVVDAYKSMLKRANQMDRGEQKRMLNVLRSMKGAVVLEDLVTVLSNVNRSPPAPGFEHLSGLPANAIVDAVQTHLFDTHFRGDVGGQTPTMRRRSLANKLESKGLHAKSRGRKIFAQLRPKSGDPHELVLAKQAMFLVLEHSVSTGIKNAAIKEKLNLVAALFNVGSSKARLTGLAGRPLLQAFALEALATSKSLMKPENEPRATLTGLTSAIRHLTEHGIENFQPDQQRALFQTLGRAYYARTDNAALMAIANLPALIRQTVPAKDLHAAGDLIERVLNHLAHRPPHEYRTIISKLSALMAFGVDYNVTESTARRSGDDRISIREISDYIGLAMRNESFQKSLMRIAGRVQAPTGDKPFRIRPKDKQSLEQGTMVGLGQDEFLHRHDKKLDEIGRGLDIETSRDVVSLDLITMAKSRPKPITLSAEEARSIVQRIENLDQSALFSTLTKSPQTREKLMQLFLDRLDEKGMSSLPSTNPKEQNARGELIEQAFRRFVRDIAAEKPSRPSKILDSKGPTPLMEQIFANGALPRKKKDGEEGPDIKRVLLSADAKAEILLMMVRGVRPDDLQRLEPSVKLEVEEALTLMVNRYMDNIGGDPETVASAKIKESLAELLGEGFAHVEKSAKGIMLEHMVESLLRLDSKMGLDGQTPTVFDDAKSITSQANTNFRSFDQNEGDTSRSLDHAIEVTEKAKSTIAGLSSGDRLGIDSKNGSGAFSQKQFKRYLVEMLYGISGEADSLFKNPKATETNETGDLSGILYVADTPDNAKHAHSQAMLVIAEILATAKDGKVTIAIGEQSKTFDLETLRAAALHLNIQFGRLSTAGLDQESSAQQLGPFTLEHQGDTIKSKIEAYFDDADNN